MALTYIDIDTNLIPYSFDIPLTNYGIKKTYTFSIKYNDVNKFFSIDIKDEISVIALGVKLCYNNYIFNKLRDSRLPDDIIVPYDVSKRATEITIDNFNKNVKLYIFKPEVFK